MSAAASFPNIPADTFAAARKVYGSHQAYLRIGDRLPDVFAGLCPGGCEEEYWLAPARLRLQLLTTFQFLERLPDSRAAEASAKRIDWKYALHAPFNDRGVPAGSLCGFRRAMFGDRAGRRMMTQLTTQLRQGDLARDLPPVNELLAAVCQVNRLDRLTQAMRQSLSMLVSTAPEWVQRSARPHWYTRYTSLRGRVPSQEGTTDLRTEATRLGEDIRWLLTALTHRSVSLPPAAIAELNSLNQLWEEQFQTAPDGSITWRQPGCAGCPSNWNTP